MTTEGSATTVDGTATTAEETDLLHRSKKKMKRGNTQKVSSDSRPVCYDDLYENEGAIVVSDVKSFKNALTGVGDEEMMASEDEEDDESMELSDSDKSEDTLPEEEQQTGEERWKIIERKYGEYDRPEFVLSPKEEGRIYRRFKYAVIVKLLGRTIGFKALETRLQDMWIKNGIMSIADLENNFFLVKFSSKEDMNFALSEGPWLIYDHYLIVRKWAPNFDPDLETIGSAAVWVRLPKLPMEYYDEEILTWMGNRIGTTVKVDLTTSLQSRGKFARICVQVDLGKPLLAMYTLKERDYSIEYEGLHFLCLGCGRFGHYVEGCQYRKKNDEAANFDGVEGQKE